LLIAERIVTELIDFPTSSWMFTLAILVPENHSWVNFHRKPVLLHAINAATHICGRKTSNGGAFGQLEKRDFY